MQDLIDRLDAELRATPAATFDTADTIRAGRRAVRRRRLAAGGAALTAAVLIGGVASLSGGGTEHARDGSVAGAPTPSASPTPEKWPADLLHEPLRMTAQGWQVNPRAKVIEHTGFTATDGTQSDIFRLRFEGSELYANGEEDGDWTAVSQDAAQGLSLREWAEMQATDDDGVVPGDQDLVTIDDDSRLTALPGVRIVGQRPDPGLGERFAAPGTPTAVAEVVRDGVTWFVVARAVPGGTEAIPYRKDRTIRTLDAFLAHARKQYAPNDEGGSEGLR